MRLWNRLLGGGEQSIARARRPQALAASLGTPPKEGIDWLGRAPDARAPWPYRATLAVLGWLVLRVCRMRVSVEGLEHLPEDGRYIAVCALHRSWIDPLLILLALPRQPRVWFMGSGATIFDRPWKEGLFRRFGGLLPAWRGGTDVTVHVRSAQAVIDAGGVLALFAEGRIGGPTDRPARMRSGAALLCLRTGAPIVPIAITGAEELYRGKRLRLTVLPPTDPADLIGPEKAAPAEPGTRAELRQARAVTRALETRLSAVTSATHPSTVALPTTARRWRWLTNLLR